MFSKKLFELDRLLLTTEVEPSATPKNKIGADTQNFPDLYILKRFFDSLNINIHLLSIYFLIIDKQYIIKDEN